MELTERTAEPEPSKKGWKQDPDGVRQNILEVARTAFADRGLSGTRIEEIAAKTKTSKRMIYYYFGDKEGLYREVLAEAYREMRQAEDALDLEELNPIDALRKLAEFTFDHHRNARDFIRLVMIENVHGGTHMPDGSDLSGQNSSAIRLLENIYTRGCEAGLFRRGLSALELHWHISALSYFNVSNQATFSRLFGDDLFSDRGQDMLRRHIGDMVLRFAMRSGVSTDAGAHQTQAPTRNINPNLTKFIEDWEAQVGAVNDLAQIADRRQRLDTYARSKRMPIPIRVETDEEHWVETSSGAVRTRVFRYYDDNTQPCLVYFHGGGWIGGSPETHWDIATRIASWNRQTVISVDYALSPESRYPTAEDQCFDVVNWVAANHRDLRISPSVISVGGDGSGGHLAASTAIRCTESAVNLRGLLLIYPLVDFNTSRPSCSENSEGPILSLEELRLSEAACFGAFGLEETRDIFGRLGMRSSRSLPPTYIALAQYDPLRDGGLALAEALAEKGVDVRTDPGEGLVHGYLQAMAYCPEAEDRLRDIAKWLVGLGP
jgi:acetyl esterase/lipase/AcrR family transcriptional regulator